MRTEKLPLFLREPLLVRVPAVGELLQMRHQRAHPRSRLSLHPFERFLHAAQRNASALECTRI